MDSIYAEASGKPSGSFRSAFLLWLIWILWLPLFVPSIINLLQAHPTLLRLMVSLVGAALFFALYLWMSWQSARSLAAHMLRRFPAGMALWAPVVALVGLGIGLTLINDYSWGSLFFYSSSGAAGWLPGKKAAVVVLALALFIAASLSLKGDFADAISPIVFVLIIGAIVIAFTWSAANSQQLRLVREEMAQAAAVNAERLRIARDLHDLLGHNLSLIALKSELAQRLVSVAPERAAREIGDIETVARKALQEVREAVASYRQPTLASELQGAREMLAVAGIAYRYDGDPAATSGLSSAVESALAWTVREGVTNVIRHSAARHCVIRLAREGERIRVEIADDGNGAAAASSACNEGNASGEGSEGSKEGNGLRGLAERVAALGGRFEVGPVVGGGFHLVVIAPLAPLAQDTPAIAPSAAQKTIGASQA